MNMTKADFLALWNGRPKDKPLPLRGHGIYAFGLSGKLMNKFVYLNPDLYRPVDWRGLV